MKNKRLEERRKRISNDMDIQVRLSFDIVDRIQEILVKQGKEQKDLAHLLHKNESEISKWMSGTHNFTISTLAKIETVLGEPVIQIIKDYLESGISSPSPIQKTYIVKRLGKISGIKKKMVVQEPESNYQIKNSENI